MMDSAIKERRNFLGRLRSDPIFLFHHLVCLSNVVARKISNKLRVKFSARHRGAKRDPIWLSRRAPGNVLDGAPARWGLPAYPGFETPVLDGAIDVVMSPDDPEAYFAQNRWGFLLDAILHVSGDQRGDLLKVEEWIESHRDREDGAWETYSTCERVANLLVYLSFFASSGDCKAAHDRLMTFVADSAEWILGHIEYYGPSATNNHILNNARALVMAGVVTGNEKSLEVGMRIFHECLPEMVGEKGFLRERSSHYQLVVSSWVMDAWRFTEACLGVEHRETKYLADLAQRMGTASSMLCDRSGRLYGMIGDVSPDTPPGNSALRLAKLYPEYWQMPDSTFQHAEITEGWFKIARDGQHVVGNFPVGVYPPAYPTHGHSDHTSFVWVCNGIEVLADAGRYRYTPDEISLVQKGARGHNVPLVDGYAPLCESMLANGLWWPTPYAWANLLGTVQGQSVVLSHDGFSRSTNVAKHTRKISLLEGGVEVVDIFDGTGHADIRMRWNFGSRFDAFDSTTMSVTGEAGKVELSMQGLTESSVCTYTDSAGGGRVSGAYGVVAPAVSVDIAGDVVLPVEITTRFKYTKCVA